MRGEFGGGVGLSVLSLHLVPWWIQVLLELAFEISLVINFRFKLVIVYIVHQDHDSHLSALIYRRSRLKYNHKCKRGV